jgi:uncharacterized protein GlcG (DUF336 family)
LHRSQGAMPIVGGIVVGDAGISGASAQKDEKIVKASAMQVS